MFTRVYEDLSSSGVNGLRREFYQRKCGERCALSFSWLDEHASHLLGLLFLVYQCRYGTAAAVSPSCLLEIRAVPGQHLQSIGFGAEEQRREGRSCVSVRACVFVLWLSGIVTEALWTLSSLPTYTEWLTPTRPPDQSPCDRSGPPEMPCVAHSSSGWPASQEVKNSMQSLAYHHFFFPSCKESAILFIL